MVGLVDCLEFSSTGLLDGYSTRSLRSSRSVAQFVMIVFSGDGRVRVLYHYQLLKI